MYIKVAVIGAGLIGRAWAVVFARGGAEVALFDSVAGQSEIARRWAGDALLQMQEFGLIDDAAGGLARIRVADDLADALAGADHVQENIAERVELKQALFQDIEKRAPATAVLASSSSAILPSVIFDSLGTRHRSLVAHPMNPPHLAPVVEVCGAPFTSLETVEKTSRFMQMCGMSVVTVEAEIEGFILNRLQFAVLNEALRLIEGGHVSARDLDKTLKDGLALRWSFMGPIETIDLNAPGGIADYMRRYGDTIRRGGALQKTSADWTDAVAEALVKERRAEVPLAHLQDGQARRDRRLMLLAKFKRGDDFTS
jgi:L-gulonate 3-dehydrogenase